MKAKPQPKRRAPTKRKKTAAKSNDILVTDREGGLPLPPEWGAKIGDDFAAWKEGESIILVFPRTYRGNRKIPKNAHWGKVEPALPEKPVTLPKPAVLDRQQALKDLIAIGPVHSKPRKPKKSRSPKRRRRNRRNELA